MSLIPTNRWLDKITASYRLNIHPSAPSNKCEDPYALPGFLNVNITHISENRWIPMDEDCQTPRMFEALRRGPEAVSEVGMREGWKDMQWVRNRTVVMFGDSVARENIVYFCEVRPSRTSRDDKLTLPPNSSLARSWIESHGIIRTHPHLVQRKHLRRLRSSNL